MQGTIGVGTPHNIERLASKTKPNGAKAQNYIEGEDTAQKTCTLEWGTPHIPSCCGEQLGWGHHTALKEKP